MAAYLGKPSYPIPNPAQPTARRLRVFYAMPVPEAFPRDYSGNGYHITGGNLVATTGPYGPAISSPLSTSNKFAFRNLGSTDPLANPTALTVACVVRIDTRPAGNVAIFGVDAFTAGTPANPFERYVLFADGSNNLLFAHSIGGIEATISTAGSGILLNDGKPHHIAATWDGATIRLYIDGILRASVAASGAIPQGNSCIAIQAANSTGSASFIGMIDACSIWDRCLSPAEVGAIAADPFLPAREDQLPEWVILAASIGQTTASGSVAFTAASTLAIAGSAAASGSVAFTAASTLAIAGSASASGSVPFAAIVALGASAGSPAILGSVAFTAASTLAIAGSAAASGSVPFAAESTLAIAGEAEALGSVAFASIATLGASTSNAALPTFEEALAASLLADGQLVALVGDRVFPVRIPQRATLPAASFKILAKPRDHDLDGASGIAAARVRFTVESPRYGDCVHVANAILDRYDGLSGPIGNPGATVVITSAYLDDEADGCDEIDSGDDAGRYRKEVEIVFRHRVPRPSLSA